MIDKYSELNQELKKPLKSSELQNYTSDRVDTLLAYGPSIFGLTNNQTKSYAEKRIQEDLKK